MSKRKREDEITVLEGDDLTALLRRVIDDSGLTRYAISKASEVPESSLSRCYTGARPATWELLKAVCDGLGLSITVQIKKTD